MTNINLRMDVHQDSITLAGPPGLRSGSDPCRPAPEKL